MDLSEKLKALAEGTMVYNIGYSKRYELDNVNSLYDMADLIIESAKRFVE